MNLEAEVRERRLTADLEEVVGGGMPPDLVARVLLRLRRRPEPRRTPLLAALLMLGGIAVVLAVADARRTGVAVARQDPVSVVTTAMVRAASRLVTAPPPGDGVDRLFALANAAGGTVVATAEVRGVSRVDLAGVDWREGTARLAHEFGVGVAEFGNVLLVGRGPPPRLDRLRVSLDTKDLDVRDLVKMLHAKAGVNLVLADDVRGRVRCQVEDVSVRALLDVVAGSFGARVVGCGQVLAMVRGRESPAPIRTDAEFSRLPIEVVLDTWAHLTHGNFVIAAGLRGLVSVQAQSPAQADFLAALGAAVAADVQCEGPVTRFVPTNAPAETATLTAENTNVQMLASLLGPSWSELLTIEARVDRPFSVFVAEAPALDLLRAAATAEGRSLLRAGPRYSVR